MMATEMFQRPARLVIPNFSHPLQNEAGTGSAGPSGSCAVVDSACLLSMPSGTWKFNVEQVLEALPPVIPRGACGVCAENVEGPAAFIIPGCSHVFCKGCLRLYTLARLEERRYPIICPVCMMVDRTSRNHVEDHAIEQLDISDKERQILLELQLAQYSMVMHCPKCKQTMNVDREDYLQNKDVTCPLSGCRHRWCTECHQAIDDTGLKHHCKNKKLDKLMRRKGWRYCPGCRVPIQKDSGCNHMTCISPGCNVHFCYKCGDLIYDPSAANNFGQLSVSLNQHFTRCRQYPRFTTLGRISGRIVRGVINFVAKMIGR